jgi:hypothetical protein
MVNWCVSLLPSPLFFHSPLSPCRWTNLTFLLTDAPYNYDTFRIGLFSLTGICTIFFAPYAGKLVDRLLPWLVTLIALIGHAVFQSIAAGGAGLSLGPVIIGCISALFPFLVHSASSLFPSAATDPLSLFSDRRLPPDPHYLATSTHFRRLSFPSLISPFFLVMLTLLSLDRSESSSSCERREHEFRVHWCALFLLLPRRSSVLFLPPIHSTYHPD